MTSPPASTTAHPLRRPDPEIVPTAYQTAARSAELLALDVEDLDLPGRRAKVCRKGGAADSIISQTATARLLPALVRASRSGPNSGKDPPPLTAEDHNQAAWAPSHNRPFLA